MSNSLDTDQAHLYIGEDLDPNWRKTSLAGEYLIKNATDVEDETFKIKRVYYTRKSSV